MTDFDVMVSDLTSLVGETVPKPAGTLAGHAAGLPFEALVHRRLEALFGERAQRHYEFLNSVLRSANGTTLEDRLNAFGPESLQRLLCRGSSAMKAWTFQKQFEEKQNDTAESIVRNTGAFDATESDLLLVDVKTYNAAKHGQAPNIISAGKLSEALSLSLAEGRVRYDFVYVGVSWEVQDETLVCTDVSVVSLFKMPPQLYINWAAAEQVQFHPHEASQLYSENREMWAFQFIEHFVSSLRRRIDKQVQRLEKFEGIITS